MPHRKTMDKVLFVREKSQSYDFVINTLAHLGYEAIVADSVDMATTRFVSDDFKVVVTEKNLEDGSGLDVLNFIRKVSPVPFIMMSDNVIDSDKEGNELLNFILLPKPFRENDLIEVFSSIMKAQESVDLVLNGLHCIYAEDDFSIIDIDEFISGREIRYDIYIKIGEQKFIKLAHGSEALSEDQIEKLKIKGVNSLYMKKKDFNDYIAMTVSLIKHMPKANISANRKSLFIQQTSKILTESVLSQEIDAESIYHAKTLVESTLNLFVGCDEILLTLEFLKAGQKDVFTHSLGVALYSMMIARNLKISTYSKLVKLAAGGMFHDLGKSKVPPHLLETPSNELTPQELLVVRNHIIYGIEMMRSIQGIPEEVITIIEQHHEDEDGGGYPMGATKKYIHPLAKIVKVADDFCEMMPSTPSIANIMRTISTMEIENSAKYDQDCVAALKQCFMKHKFKAA